MKKFATQFRDLDKLLTGGFNQNKIDDDNNFGFKNYISLSLPSNKDF